MPTPRRATPAVATETAHLQVLADADQVHLPPEGDVEAGAARRTAQLVQCERDGPPQRVDIAADAVRQAHLDETLRVGVPRQAELGKPGRKRLRVERQRVGTDPEIALEPQ